MPESAPPDPVTPAGRALEPDAYYWIRWRDRDTGAPYGPPLIVHFDGDVFDVPGCMTPEAPARVIVVSERIPRLPPWDADATDGPADAS